MIDKSVVRRLAHLEMRLTVAKEEIKQLRAKVAELEVDAKRYRALRNNTSIMTFEQQTWVTSHKLDMRVDRAMYEQNSKQLFGVI